MSSVPPIHTTKNQYRGINAHLHSFWQAAQKWNRFHHPHVDDLFRLMKALLLPIGYTVNIEESMQIRREEALPALRPKPDITVRDASARHPAGAATRGGEAAPLIEGGIALESLLEPALEADSTYAALAVSTLAEDPRLSETVAWVELLSPSNKGDTRDAYAYLAKRHIALEHGIVFVELDYLHETPPTFERLPDYTRGDPDAHPYRISVIDPRPDYQDGTAWLHTWDVDMPLPVVKIPLNGHDVLTFDFDAAYQRTFEGALYGFDRELNYAELPQHFARYSEADRSRIANRMLTVLRAAENGADLEAAPLPVTTLPLDEALHALDALRG